MAILTPSYPVSVKVDRCLHVLTLDSVYRSQIAGKCFLTWCWSSWLFLFLFGGAWYQKEEIITQGKESQQGSRENAKEWHEAIGKTLTTWPSVNPKKILTTKVITCIEEYSGETFSFLYRKFNSFGGVFTVLCQIQVQFSIFFFRSTTVW